MKMNLMAIIGLVLIVGFVVFGFVSNFETSWLLSIVGASAGLAMIIGEVANKEPDGSKWKAILVGTGLSVGTMMAVFGGVTESAIVSIVGAVIVIVTVIIGILKEKT